MTISELGSIGEFVSSIAVVLSLIYVAIQVRQNTKEMRAASKESNANKFVDFNMAIASNPDLLKVMMLLGSGKTIDELEPEQATKAHLVFNSVYNLTYQYHSRFREGVADREHWESLNNMIRFQLVPSPLFRSWFVGFMGNDGPSETAFTKLLRQEIESYESNAKQGDA